MSKPLIRLEDGNKIFTSKKGMLASVTTTQALKDINISIYQGETLGLVGESGSGKTTLGRCLLTLEDLTSGNLYYKDNLVTKDNLKDYRKNLQIIFQDPYSSLNPRRSALESVMEPLLLSTDYQSAKAKAIDLLNLVGITGDNVNKLPRAFSGGQRQRIGIARAIITNPEFILCDEPTSALDVSIQIQILDLLKDLQEEYHLTYLFISHDLSVVSYICDKIAVMYQGQLVEYASTKDIFENPQHAYTKKLLASKPILDPDLAVKALMDINTDTSNIVLSDNYEWKEVSKEHFVRIDK